jgi:hypothetical protein
VGVKRTEEQRDELLRKFAEFADGRADAAAVAELNEILESDADARLLYLQWLDLQIELENAPVPAVEPKKFPAFWGAAAAAALVFAGILWQQFGGADGTGGTEPEFVEKPTAHESIQGLHVAAADGASWVGDQRPLDGSLVPLGSVLSLSSGKVEMVDGDVRYVVAGPARFVAGENGLQLDQGDLLVRVRGERQVQILTPSAKLRDLGTIFGVTVRGDEESCHVFEGVVEAEPNWKGAGGETVDTVRIKTGASRSLRPQVGGAFAVAERADWLRFPWSLVGREGIRSLGGRVELGAAAPSEYDPSLPMVLVPEGTARLEKNLPVDLVGAGSFKGPFEEATKRVRKGTNVRSYVAHFAPGRHKPPREWRVAVIEFDKPIVGVSCSAEALNAADRVFGNVAMDELADNELAKKGHLALEKEDAIRISEDRRQIAIYVAAWFVDQSRILTEE